MDKQPAFDRSIWIPIFISGFSVIGIVVVLMIGRLLNAPAEVAVTPSATRFQYVYLGTEPVITTPLIEETEIGPTEPPVEEPGVVTPVIATTRPAVETLATPATLIILASPTGTPQGTITPPTPTATSASGPPLNPGTYDDVDSHLVYNGWNATNSGGTLHVSTVPGSTLSFRFIGRQLRFVYQGGSTLGQLRITIDNSVTATLDQSSGAEWASEVLANSTHTVLITHIGGGSVNLDQVIIPEPSNTPTPTQTRTTTAP